MEKTSAISTICLLTPSLHSGNQIPGIRSVLSLLEHPKIDIPHGVSWVMQIRGSKFINFQQKSKISEEKIAILKLFVQY